MSTKTIIGIVVLVILIAGGILILSKNTNAPTTSAPLESINTTSTTTQAVTPSPVTTPKPVVTPVTTPKPVVTPTPTPTPAPTVKQYTLAEVAQHSTAQNCWSAVNSKVYNLTSWIGQHPGGSNAIISMCGRDASAAYNDQHGGQRRPANELAGFYIGDLK